MIGAEVTELIQGYIIGKKLETTEEDLMETVFPHPTLSEMMHESVLDAYDRVIHILIRPRPGAPPGGLMCRALWGGASGGGTIRQGLPDAGRAGRCLSGRAGSLRGLGRGGDGHPSSASSPAGVTASVGPPGGWPCDPRRAGRVGGGGRGRRRSCPTFPLLHGAARGGGGGAPVAGGGGADAHGGAGGRA